MEVFKEASDGPQTSEEVIPAMEEGMVATGINGTHIVTAGHILVLLRTLIADTLMVMAAKLTDIRGRIQTGRITMSVAEIDMEDIMGMAIPTVTMISGITATRGIAILSMATSTTWSTRLGLTQKR